MGLFMNSNGHPTIFRSNTDILEHNQELYKIDPMLEWMKEQRESNDSINRQLIALEVGMKQQKHTQSNQWQTVRNRLNTLMDSDVRHDQFENEVMESLAKLDAENDRFQHALAGERLLDQEIIVKINEQLVNQENLSEQISKQADVQKDVLNRLDTQEGLTEKVLRQMDHFRTILYERTNYLTEKIEDGYSMTASYMAKLLSSSDQPLARFMLKQKQEDTD